MRNRRLCLSVPNDAWRFWENPHRRGCRTGVAQVRHQGETRRRRSDRAIITPAPYRTLILVKVPCSIGAGAHEEGERRLTYRWIAAGSPEKHAFLKPGKPAITRRRAPEKITLQNFYNFCEGGLRNSPPGRFWGWGWGRSTAPARWRSRARDRGPLAARRRATRWRAAACDCPEKGWKPDSGCQRIIDRTQKFRSPRLRTNQRFPDSCLSPKLPRGRGYQALAASRRTSPWARATTRPPRASRAAAGSPIGA